jgi:hypothetical protein
MDSDWLAGRGDEMALLGGLVAGWRVVSATADELGQGLSFGLITELWRTWLRIAAHCPRDRALGGALRPPPG